MLVIITCLFNNGVALVMMNFVDLEINFNPRMSDELNTCRISKGTSMILGTGRCSSFVQWLNEVRLKTK